VNHTRKTIFALLVLFLALAVFSGALFVVGTNVLDSIGSYLSSLRTTAPHAEPEIISVERYVSTIASLLAPVVFGGAFAVFILSWLAMRIFVFPLLQQPGGKDVQDLQTKEHAGKAAPLEKKIDTASAASLLSLLQQEGRLIDFLQEDLSQYEDSQIGAAVRGVHEGCRKVLAESLRLDPVVSGEEGTDYVVEKGFDPARIKLIGNVTGEPPFKGVLRHHGWQVSRLNLPQHALSQGEAVIVPAEVEVA